MENAVFQLPQGIELTDREGLSQGYSTKKGERFTSIYSAISAENLFEVLTRLFETIPVPAFFILEVPTDRETEETLRKQDSASAHINVYYWDGLQTDEMISLFHRWSQLLIHDGMCGFGFASHEKTNEVFIDVYKTIRIMTNQPERFLEVLRQLNVPQKDPLRTAWDTLTPETPGTRSLFTDQGKTIYNMVEQLQNEGLYFAEHRAQQ